MTSIPAPAIPNGSPLTLPPPGGNCLLFVKQVPYWSSVSRDVFAWLSLSLTLTLSLFFCLFVCFLQCRIYSNKRRPRRISAEVPMGRLFCDEFNINKKKTLQSKSEHSNGNLFLSKTKRPNFILIIFHRSLIKFSVQSSCNT